MIKELKYLFFIVTIILFVFVNIRFYFSDDNKKKSYRSHKTIEKKIENFSKDIPILKNDTNNIIIWVENKNNLKKKSYLFWGLLDN
tara:strand:+ start:561 stop:818 length:258 start_codon:yes stop_codon:yes gene_type:complete